METSLPPWLKVLWNKAGICRWLEPARLDEPALTACCQLISHMVSFASIIVHDLNSYSPHLLGCVPALIPIGDPLSQRAGFVVQPSSHLVPCVQLQLRPGCVIKRVRTPPRKAGQPASSDSLPMAFAWCLEDIQGEGILPGVGESSFDQVHQSNRT